jgi:hypothetical protein
LEIYARVFETGRPARLSFKFEAHCLQGTVGHVVVTQVPSR